jgi:hypothetical protein
MYRDLYAALALTFERYCNRSRCQGATAAVVQRGPSIQTLGLMNTTSSPPIRVSLDKSVLAVELFDLSAHRLIGTFHREKSRCTFTDSIAHGAFELELRLDWGDTSDGEPTLDLDVKERQPDGTIKQVKPRNIPSHHTKPSSLIPGSAEPRTYDLEYKGLRLRLVARKTFATSASLSAYIVNGSGSEGT